MMATMEMDDRLREMNLLAAATHAYPAWDRTRKGAFLLALASEAGSILRGDRLLSEGFDEAARWVKDGMGEMHDDHIAYTLLHHRAMAESRFDLAYAAKWAIVNVFLIDHSTHSAVRCFELFAPETLARVLPCFLPPHGPVTAEAISRHLGSREKHYFGCWLEGARATR